MAKAKGGSEKTTENPKSVAAKKGTFKGGDKKSDAAKKGTEGPRSATVSSAETTGKGGKSGQAAGREPAQSSKKAAVKTEAPAQAKLASKAEPAAQTAAKTDTTAKPESEAKPAPKSEPKSEPKSVSAAKPDTVGAPAAPAGNTAKVSVGVPADAAPAPGDIQTPPLETEPPDQLDGIALPASRGNAAVFGGPKDRSLKPDDKLGLPTGAHFQYEKARNLHPKAYYCQMRWEYRQHHMSTEEGKRWWANKKILVSNPSGGGAVVVKAVDYGPHESTGLVIGISPAAAEAIGIEAGHEVQIKFADQKAPLGPVERQPE